MSDQRARSGSTAVTPRNRMSRKTPRKDPPRSKTPRGTVSFNMLKKNEAKFNRGARVSAKPRRKRAARDAAGLKDSGGHDRSKINAIRQIFSASAGGTSATGKREGNWRNAGWSGARPQGGGRQSQGKGKLPTVAEEQRRYWPTFYDVDWNEGSELLWPPSLAPTILRRGVVDKGEGGIPEEVIDTFRKYDKNDDGYLDSKEIFALLYDMNISSRDRQSMRKEILVIVQMNREELKEEVKEDQPQSLAQKLAAGDFFEATHAKFGDATAHKGFLLAGGKTVGDEIVAMGTAAGDAAAGWSVKSLYKKSTASRDAVDKRKLLSIGDADKDKTRVLEDKYKITKTDTELFEEEKARLERLLTLKCGGVFSVRHFAKLYAQNQELLSELLSYKAYTTFNVGGVQTRPRNKFDDLDIGKLSGGSPRKKGGKKKFIIQTSKDSKAPAKL